MLNKVQLIGIVDTAPKPLNFPNTKAISFKIDTPEQWTDKNTNEIKTSHAWHTIVVTNTKYVDESERLTVGAKVYVEGKLKTRKWDNNGVDSYVTEVLVDFTGNFMAFNGAGPLVKEPSTQENRAVPAAVFSHEDDELPF